MTERMPAEPVQKDITTALRDLDQTQEEIRSRVISKAAELTSLGPRVEISRYPSLRDRRPYFVR